MLSDKQLDLAVSRAIITREQAEALAGLAGGDNNGNGQATEMDFSVAASDEPFRLLKGFRDFFIAIGIVILAVGLSMFVGSGPFALGVSDNSNGVMLVGTGWSDILALLVLVGIAIAISEWVTKSQRLPLSSLVLTLVFALWAGFLASSVFYVAATGATVEGNFVGELAPYAGITGAIAALIWYYRRYRLPFVLLPLAGSAVLGVVMLSGAFDLDSDSVVARIAIGLSGVGVFVAAMWYDMKDRYRTTRLSECAFWLHLLAAPMIVHSVLFNGLEGTIGSITILMVVAVLAIFALIIDRRAMLVSALIYLGYSIFTIIKSVSTLGDLNNSAAFVILGVFVLGLGLGWAQIRRFFVTNLVWRSLRDKLPPVIA